MIVGLCFRSVSRRLPRDEHPSRRTPRSTGHVARHPTGGIGPDDNCTRPATIRTAQRSSRTPGWSTASPVPRSKRCLCTGDATVGRSPRRPDDAPRQHRCTAEGVEVVDGVELVVGRSWAWQRNTATARPWTSAATPRSGVRASSGQTSTHSSADVLALVGGGAPLDDGHRIATATSRSTWACTWRSSGVAGRIWPRSSTNTMVGSGWSGAFTNDTNRATRSGWSIVAFHSHS